MTPFGYCYKCRKSLSLFIYNLPALYGGLSDDSVDDADNGNDSVPDMYVGKQIL